MIGIRWPLALFMFALTAGTASAATPADIAREWGLIGRWATDCAANLHAKNSVAYEITKEGRLTYRTDRVHEIADVRIGENHMLILHTVFPEFRQTRENGIVLQADGTLRSIYNRDDAGNYTVRDGRFVASGGETSGLHRCEGANSS